MARFVIAIGSASMFAGLSKAQMTVGGIIAAIAVVGWIVALVAMAESGGLEDEVARVEADLAARTGALAKAEEALKQLQDGAGTLEDVTQKVETANYMGDLEIRHAAVTNAIEVVRGEARKDLRLEA